MNKIFLTLITIFIVITANGQTETSVYEKGYVHLKNGTVIKGRYIYSSNMEKLQIITGKNTFVFNASEVDFVSKKGSSQGAVENEFAENSPSSSKVFNLTEIGVLIGNPDNSQSAPMVLGSSFNYSFHKKISIGAGVGVEFLKETYLPVTANLMYKFRKTRFTPYAILQAGYQIPLEDSRINYYDLVPNNLSSSSIWPGFWPGTQDRLEAEGGWLLNPAIGLISLSRNGFGISLSVGYRFHRLRYSNSSDYAIDVDYNRVTVKLGLIIN